jgi:hypothetical protein
MKIIKSCSSVREKAKRSLMKHPHTPETVAFVKKQLRGPRYMYRFVDPEWGITYGSHKEVNSEFGIGMLTFESRNWMGGYGWDTDRHRMHMYTKRAPKTKKIYRWQWRWAAYGYDYKRDGV